MHTRRQLLRRGREIKAADAAARARHRHRCLAALAIVQLHLPLIHQWLEVGGDGRVLANIRHGAAQRICALLDTPARESVAGLGVGIAGRTGSMFDDIFVACQLASLRQLGQCGNAMRDRQRCRAALQQPSAETV
ncbi:hypothetical protein SDC9_150678 [bioreactor metagenome]|uniref:Uncharacterized protein n=1 Tax=bioreactor metagenome TaxID=1076179 RepID=A0A645EN53_9ZZZZ